MRRCVALFLLGICVVAARGEVAEKVSVCELAKNRKTYDHKVIEVTGFITHGFEDSELIDPTCERTDIWVEFGGYAGTDTVYARGGYAYSRRKQPLVVEGIKVALVEDANFIKLNSALQRKPSAIVRATLIGTFFSGKPMLPNAKGMKDKFFGYGHMGCCSLFVLQQVISVETSNDTDLNGSPDSQGPNPKDGKDCTMTNAQGIGIFDYSRWLNEQREADEGERARAYDEPLWAAMSVFGDPVRIRSTMDGAPQEIDIAPGLRWYSWRLIGVKGAYGALVSRPFMLSYYAKDPKKVVWIATRADYSSCGYDSKMW